MINKNGVNNMNDEINNGGFQDAPKVVGLPGGEGTSSSVQQHFEDTCAVRSQELILRDFGVQVSEDSLRNEALGHGWYTPGGGTSAENIGNLLELHGVDVNRYENANIITLTSELAKGHKVIIGVDSGELWNHGLQEGFEDKLGFQQPDHALIVSGIDTSDPDHVKVVLTDPGSGDIAKEYPMEQFVDAWKDSNCLMVTTAQPAPAWLPEMANFDYNLGHIESIGNLPYDEFQTHYGTEENLHAHNFSPTLENPLDDFLQAVAGEDTHFPNLSMDGDDPFHLMPDPDLIPELHDPIRDVDQSIHHEPTIAELIQQHNQHLDPSHELSIDGLSDQATGQTDLDGLHHNV
jgi:hypothetical protein